MDQKNPMNRTRLPWAALGRPFGAWLAYLSVGQSACMLWLAGSAVVIALWWPVWWPLQGLWQGAGALSSLLMWSLVVLGRHHARDAQVQAFAQALDQLAERRMDLRLPIGRRDELGRLASHFNAAAQGLADQVGKVVQATSAVANAGDEMSLAAQTLAIRTEDQSNVIAQTTTAIEDVLASVRCTSDMASSVDAMSQQLCEQADQSEQVVANAVSAIQRIRHSTKEMTEALAVIDTLTFQTNILALNAAVEAARAGNAGRGFAVVAGEVRALATRTAEASTQVKAVIARSNQEVVAGVREVESVKAAINDIGKGFRDVSAQMRDVSSSNLAQSAAIGLISQGLDQLSVLTRANTDLVVESVGASERLRCGAQELNWVTAGLLGAPDGASLRHDAAEPSQAVAQEGIEFF